MSTLSVDQENVFNGGKREMKNGPSSASKRPALTTITTNNMQRRFSEEILRPHGGCSSSISFMQPQQDVVGFQARPIPPSSTMPSLSNLFSSSSASLSNALQYSFEDSGFSLSTSTISFTSPGLCSPMLVSSPEDDPHLPQLVSDSDGFEEYSEEIHSNLKNKETLLSPPAGFISLQPDINSNMRSILVDWLVEVAEEFQLHLDTLYLAIAYTDRYLSRVSVPRSKLQLVGTTSLYIAAKFEEIHPPDIGEFAYITDDTYTKKQIVKLEQDMLKVLDFQLVQPTVYTFISRYMQISKHDAAIEEVHCLANYLGELSLLDIDPFSKYVPSIIAASAICLARHTFNIEAWPLLLQNRTGYRLGEINHCLQDLHRTHALAHKHNQQAVRAKYMTTKYLQIARINSPETLPC